MRFQKIRAGWAEFQVECAPFPAWFVLGRVALGAVAAVTFLHATIPLGAPAPTEVALAAPVAATPASAPASVAAPAAMSTVLVDFISDRWGVEENRAAEFVKAATVAAKTEAVDPLLVLAVVANESSFTHMGNIGDRTVDIHPRHVNPLYSHGPMQVAGRWHPDEMPVDAHGRMRVTTTSENIQIGTRLLGRYLKREGGNVKRALLRYNGTLDDVQAKYAMRVLRFRQEFKQALLES